MSFRGKLLFVSGSDTPDKQINQGIGHGNKIVIFIRMQPGINNFVNGAQDKPFDQADVKILADAAFLLACFNDFRYQILVHLGHFPDLGFCQTAVLMGFNLIHHSHIPISLEFRKMAPNKAAQFIMAAIELVDGRPKSIKNLLGSVVEKLDQNIVFIFKIKINGTICHTGLSGNLGNG